MQYLREYTTDGSVGLFGLVYLMLLVASSCGSNSHAKNEMIVSSIETDVNSSPAIRDGGVIEKLVNICGKEYDIEEHTELVLGDPSCDQRDLQQLEKFRNLKRLKINFVGFTDANILNGIVSLVSLDISGTKVKDIEALRAHKRLEHLSLPPGIESIGTIRDLRSLHSLTIQHSEIFNIHMISSLLELEELRIVDIPAQDFSALSNLTNLKVLHLGYLAISRIGFLDSLHNLESLSLEEIPIVELPKMSNLKNLKKVWMVGLGGELSLKPLGELTGLTEVVIRRYKLLDIYSVCEHPGVKELELNSFDNQSIGCFEKMVNLKRLAISGNAIQDVCVLSKLKDIDVLRFENMSVGRMECFANLEFDQLAFVNTDLSDISPLANLGHLRVLAVKGSTVRNLEMVGKIKGLNMLEIESERYEKSQIIDLEKQNPNIYISLSRSSSEIPEPQ